MAENTIRPLILIGAAAALLIGGMMLLSPPGKVRPGRRVHDLLTLDRPLVIAHRGFSLVAPENTLPAFRLAIQVQADLVELDYLHSQDGVPVVLHDRTLDRTTNAPERWGDARIPVSSRPLEDLRRLDAGSWFNRHFAGIRLPTLEEALEVIQPSSITLIERKEGDAPTLIDLLRRMNQLSEVIVQAFDWTFLAECHALEPRLALGALGPPSQTEGRRLAPEERFLSDTFLDQIAATGARVVGWNRQVTPEGIAEAHRRGLRVWVYTINDLETALALLQMGVDGIISDDPVMVWKALMLHQNEPQG